MSDLLADTVRGVLRLFAWIGAAALLIFCVLGVLRLVGLL